MRTSRSFAALILLAALARMASADGPDHADAAFLKDAARETGAIASAPLRWDRSDWSEAGAVIGTAGALYAGADVWAQHATRRNQSRVANGFADVGRGFGNGFYLAPALAAAYLGGEAARDKRLRRASLDAAESFAISGLFVTGVKFVSGRNRPRVGNGRGDWDGPSSGNSRYSFPSGHSAAAFSVATIFATEYGDVPGLAPGAYALATLTALSRIYHDQHWASDVFVGGALGYFTAKAVALSHQGPDGRWAFSAFPAGNGAGATVAFRF